jgi:hypothetical protein
LDALAPKGSFPGSELTLALGFFSAIGGALEALLLLLRHKTRNRGYTCLYVFLSHGVDAREKCGVPNFHERG